MALVNQNNEKLSKWINNKTTKIFLKWEYNGLISCFHITNQLAKNTKSYNYPIFKRKNNKLKHVGYAVPK